MNRAPNFPWPALAISALAVLAACTVGPDYTRPSAETPPAFKEAAGWKRSKPLDTVPRGAWWSVYGDPVLDSLEREVEISNETIKAADAAFRQSRALAHEAEASFFPVVGTTGSAQRSGTGAQAGGRVANQFNLTTSASWELDLWGRIRRQIEASVATAQASAADLANAQLSAQAALATDYLELRVSDELKHLLDEAVVDFQKSLVISQNKYRAGVVAKSDVASAQALLDGTRAAAINVGVTRATLEHAIAVLIGKPPAEFSIAPAAFTIQVPTIPVELPSTLLERRPDIAATERLVQASNAQIGAAVAAYYPTLTLSGSYGFSNSMLSKLIEGPSSLWAVAGQAAETLFDFGLRSAQVEAARATFDQNVATYRETVLSGFQQVEDDLATLRILEEQQGVQASAVKSAREAVQLFLNQYKAGTIDYTSVITAENTALQDQESELTILRDRLAASVALIEALGGGWDATHLPSDEQLDEGRKLFP